MKLKDTKMKTINEAAEEYSIRKENEHESYMGFEAGVEFTQRFISTKDEMPDADDFSIDLEILTDNGAVVTGYYFSDGDWMRYNEDKFGVKIKRKVVGWKPLAFK